MTILQHTFPLANGVKMPRIGFGTWQIPDGEETYKAVRFALAHGYRHIDTAHAYGNEASVGRAVRDSGVPREDIFVTSKLPAEIKSHDETLASFDETLVAIGLDYIDLYLIHAPWPWREMGTDYSSGNKAVWKAFETIYASGRTRAIGVSNFEVRDLEAVLEDCSVDPMVNQVKYFIGNRQDEIVDFCRLRKIQVEGFSPLATGGILENESVKAIAAHYHKSVAQICIRYVLQKGVAPLPKSTNGGRIIENGDVDFEITLEDMATLDALHDISAFAHGPKL